MSHKSTPESFWNRVKKSDTCWMWQGSTDAFGYGMLSYHGETISAHRLSYRFTHGTIPPNTCILHRCDNPPCCNPVHLFVGTRADNIIDMNAKGRAVLRGAQAKGEAHAFAKLTALQVKEIRARYIPRVVSRGRLASEYGVTRSTIADVLHGRTWRT